MSGGHIVYVHGICRHDSGFSNDWFDALRPFVPSLQPGDLSPTVGDLSRNRHEVLWSDIVNESAAEAAAIPFVASADLASADEQSERAACREGLIEELQQRMQRAQAEVIPAGKATTEPTAAPQAEALGGIPGLDCIDDFTAYLASDSIRNQVLARFDAVIKPLLAAGKKIEVLSHSWGTVVTYEALRRFDAAPNIGSGRVHNFFTVGSALAINFVNNRLIPAANDRRRPVLVERWINLDARGDFVGGSLTNDGFELEPEHDFIGLTPVGCGIIPSPACAHSSYFDSANEAVNKDIFGALIES